MKGVYFLDKTVKILVLACSLLVIILGITSGMVISEYYADEPQNQTINHNTTQNISQNQTLVKKTTTQKVKTIQTNNTNSKYITTICKKCGKAFTQPRNGPQYYYCDKCWNSPEVQKEWEKETE